ncbi:hypothetical protein EGW08_022945 [Elysia chlorotica]|uniref:CCHC-type domain-containing protein n=1 Tax=Elysia chlorotica TaxID=188477 RepID=A0A433SJP8_ELYCH|nr:hypothetical protein EGW08_022945 [Elysia chlorotica]
MLAGETSVRRPSNLPSPKSFDGTAEQWPRWKARFQRYRLCSGLCERPDHEQVGTLLYSMGDIADDLLAVTKIDEGTTTYDEAIALFDKHFNSRKNTIFARATFNRRCQQAAKHQAKQDLTLEDAIRLSRQAEARTENQAVLRSTPTVDLIQRSYPRKQKNTTPQKLTATTNRKCGYCGKAAQHKREACPARSATCHKCSKKGHYSSVCRSAPVREVQLQETEEAGFLGCVQHVGEVATWTAVLHIDGTPEKFKLDTGAAVSVVGEKIAIGRDLQPCDKVLKGPGDTPLHVIGLFHAFLKYKDR